MDNPKALWLMFLLGHSLWHLGAAKDTQQYTQGQGPLYRSSATIFRQLRLLNSTFVSNVALKDPNSSRTHQMFRIVNREVVTSQEQEQQMPTAFLICNQHAREMITGEICNWLVRLLAQDTSSLMEWPVFIEAITKGVGASRLQGNASDLMQIETSLKQWVANITSKLKVEVVPIVNQEGRDYIQRTGNFDQRKTVATQVDLNRNWPINRAQPESGANELQRNTEEYQGPAALSEWQTRTLYTYMKSISKPELFIDVHSGQWSVMCPWGGTFNYSSLRPETVTACQELFNITRPAFSKLTKDELVTFFTSRGIATGPGSGMLYKSEGSSDDTAYADIGFNHVLTVETYAPPNSGDSGVGYTCPPMADWVRDCNEENMCGDTVCKTRRGQLRKPSAGKVAASAAAAALGLQDVSSSEPSAVAARQMAAKAAVTQTPRNTFNVPKNAARDPFLRKLSTVSMDKAYMFTAFNPAGAAQYKMTTSRWLAAMLFALDKVAGELQ